MGLVVKAPLVFRWTIFSYLILTFLAGFFLFSSQESVAQTQPDTFWTFSQVRSDTNQDSTLDYSGKEVTITGIANVETGLLHEHYLQSFVQNDSAGLSIFAMDVSTPFKPGDSLVVTGEIQNYRGMAELSVNNYRVFSDVAEEPDPKPLVRAIENPQKYMGMLVEGEGIITEKGNIYNGKYLRVAPSDTARSSIMLYATNFHVRYQDFNFDVLSIGDHVFAKGVIGEYNPEFPNQRTYKVILRNPDELKYAGLPRYYGYLIVGGLFLIGLVITGWIIMLRRRVNKKTQQIQRSLQEKDVLLKEIHHRVKNNLSIISGLIGLQLDMTDNAEAQQVLQDSQSRIHSMATIHDKLYQTDSLSEIRLDSYLQELVETIHSTFDRVNDSVSLQFDMEPADIDIDKVVPCGLLVNELVVHAFKHAFIPGKKGVLYINLQKRDDKLELSVIDNGPGLPQDFGLNDSDSLGAMLIRTFASQLKAETEILDHTKGAGFKFIFSPNAMDD